jgi:hypothetical protein
MAAPPPPASVALCAAAEMGDHVEVARLLDAGADPNGANEVGLGGGK